MTVEQLRLKLDRLLHDIRLTQFERDSVRIRTLGILNTRPRTVGEAKRYITALETAIQKATTEVPL